MRNFFEKFMMFMQGRYGMDSLNGFILVLSFVIWTVNIFVFNRLAHYIIMVVQLLLVALFIFRMLSRNVTMRSAENRRFQKVYEPVKNWVQLTYKRIRDRKDYRYLKCPVCKAQLRVKNIKGRHNVRCPKCRSEFEKKI
ncbi:MAG: hypothetical protein IIY42_01555 [Ruminococcus sp.]|jgi:Ca2+/Na+ antiporter|uniref:hypothetical protein n=1 Tax=unclassified Ruminococcus TaxID=2608920 RepID=UPI00292FF95E|nr:hypothetical protein [uncultured Ruminococcus sp.]MBQ1353510.1 hypothetical protein [Ruminococcus sp.]MBQ1594961.1 hypothetical protein [Ruminococcus sp.]MBQ1716390.1 hypothetical protein [Ruminococcus sp.]MBQ1830514.1 hypothetical protein [Ruminococcus sp.]MBQ1921104.1 hypothetical protein [Ruminococcus sp.]